MYHRGHQDVRFDWIIHVIWPPVLDYSIASEQWAAMEAAMSSTIKPKSFRFSPEKVAQVKQRCKKSLPMLQPSSFISSNDIITAILGISIDRAQHPKRASNNENAGVTMTVDLRGRVQPPLPDTYVGNTAFPVQNDTPPLSRPPDTS
ncbi:uncharacterized protein ASPGLDRAFT_43586 [Aspergillus glaucus CBS 516.65]|uniref:Uncharacterized protein n=1 Tax=Aspergillus glaucus CBS 516.65 TaxID=1160497 RepID=A0A1L9VT79_ASPGL|nr:hypothetical protein ASPGLDRAFT_43586 [Aspergillus glaucus CBS 516.65]OJJ87100.1 hypothetical protein ASPGLDRAFT_43586 [Aspergillus glaucus CBS 516.65]